MRWQIAFNVDQNRLLISLLWSSMLSEKMVQCTKCISLCGGFHSLDAKCLNILLLRFRHIPSLMDYFALSIFFHRSFSFSLSNRYIFQAPLYSHFSHPFRQETIAAIRVRFKFRHRREFFYLSTKMCVWCSKNMANKKKLCIYCKMLWNDSFYLSVVTNMFILKRVHSTEMCRYA